MKMKTCITILLLLVASSCLYVLSYRARVRILDFQQPEGAASKGVQEGIESLGQQIQFTDNGINNAHTVVDVWIVLFLLFGFFVSRYLRLRTNNDFISRCEYVILSFLELIFLNGAVIKLIVTLHKFIVGEDSEQKILDEMLPEACVLNAKRKGC